MSMLTEFETPTKKATEMKKVIDVRDCGYINL
jgi:hypothetical protein